MIVSAKTNRLKTGTTNHTQTQVPPHGAQIWLSPSPVAPIQGLADEQGRRGGTPACTTAARAATTPVQSRACAVVPPARAALPSASHEFVTSYTFIYEDGRWPLRRLNQPITSTLNEKNLYVKLSDWYVVTPRAYLSPVGEEVDEELAFIPG